MKALFVALVLVLPALSGCFVTDFLHELRRPDLTVERTLLDTEGWTTDPVFRVRVLDEGVYDIHIEWEGPLGSHSFYGVSGADMDAVEVTLPDGSWQVTYFVAGHHWETFESVRVDTVPPVLLGLEEIGQATGRVYVLGEAAALDDPTATLQIIDQSTGDVLGTALPLELTGLGDGIHFFDIIATDPAGNQAVWTVQVRVGDGEPLPAGQHSAGIVARYTNQLRIWDLSSQDAYLGRPAAQAQAPGYLGSGFQIDPQDPMVLDIVASEVTADMNTMQTALALYEWVFDNLDYDRDRLETSNLLSPSETIDNGGGVCRDLAALYVSLLRAADVPARVVTGYLGGDVGGFHAWVEFYGGQVGNNPGPWIPVDVSPIDGRWDDPVQGSLTLGPASTLQHFAIQRPDYLTLRVVPPGSEGEGWATALSVSYPQNQPVPSFTTTLHDPVDPTTRVLCVDLESWGRFTVLAGQQSQCPDRHIPDYPFVIQRVIDYGITAAPGSSGITLSVAYPFEEDVAPDEVQYTLYGGTDRVRDEVQGTWTMTVRG